MNESMMVRIALCRRIALAALTVPVLLTACAGKRKNEWVPRPRVHWEDLSTAAVARVEEGYQIQVPTPTRGVFPASLGITRLAVEETSPPRAPSGRRRTLLTDPRNEFLHWNRTLDDLLAVSEVFPVSQTDLGGGPADPEQIIAAFHALHARLGLVYAVNELSPTKAEMIGVLYDTQTQKPMAAIRATAESVEGPPAPLSLKKTERDAWTSDARALVRRRFQQYVHACMRELILQDELERVSVPEGWIPAEPARPVVWPPRYLLRPSSR